MKKIVSAIAAVTFLDGFSTALAQQADLVAAARAGVAAMGKQWNGEVSAATRALYVDVHREVGSSGIRQVADLSYGPHDQQTFDLFLPEQTPNEPRPVLVFVHGGGFVRGDKVGADGLIYSNVTKWMARSGGIGVNMNYRLVPDATFPSGAEDIRMLLTWLRDNIAAYGGDPDNVLLMGNSAGAAHVAAYLFHEPSQLDGGPEVRGAVLSSGAFLAGDDPNYVAYYGENASERARRAPVALVESYDGEPVPILLWNAEYDPASIETSVERMYAALCRRYTSCPMRERLEGHNHVSHVMSIDTPDTAVTDAIMRFYHSVAD